MNRHLLSVSFLLLTSALAGATPVVSGVSGTIADDQTVVISGSGFGSNSLKQEWLGGSSGRVDSQANGTRIDTLGWPNWSLLTPSTPTYPHVSTERSWSGGKSIAFDTRGTTEYKQTLFYDTGSAGYTTMYTNALIYLDYQTLLSGSRFQWKMIRWYKVADVLDHANNLSGALMSNWQGTNPASYLAGFNASSSQYTYWFNDLGSKQILPGKGAWYRYETWVKMNSTPGTADGTYRVKVTDPVTGSVVVDQLISNVMYNATGDSGNFRYVVLQNYFGNASNGGYSQPDNAQAVAWWDDIYMSQSQARVEVCSSPTWAQCASREIQAASVWSDGSITVKLNKGANLDFTNAYLYVTDSSGAVNASGYKLTGVSTAVVAPAAPSNLQAVPQ